MKGKRLKRLNGAVLVMILTVMLVLMILLMATLTVVTTASQRIYTKYEENQAYYSARSALDVFTQNMLSDSAYIAQGIPGTPGVSGTSGARQFEYTDSSAATPTTKQADMKQGLALQLDLYKIRSQSDDGKDLSYVENALAGDGTFSSGSPEEKNFALSNTDSYTKNGTTYKGLEYIEYDVKLPAVSDGSDEYGKMVDKDIDDKDGDGDKTDQVARIRVEVLDRKLATDPSYTTAQIELYFDPSATAAAKAAAGCPVDDTALKTAVANGSRSKDYMKIKITSTIEMMGVEGTAVVIFETTEKDPPAGDNAITTTGGYAGGGGAQFGAAGGAATMDPGTSTIADGNTVSGKLFSVGSFNWKSASKTDFGKGDKVVAMGDISFENDPTIYSKAPGMFFYAGGTIYARGNMGGSDGSEVSLVCNRLSTKGKEYNLKGNVFCDTIDIIGNTAGNEKVDGKVYANTIATDYVQEILDDEGKLLTLKVGGRNHNINLWSNGKIQHVQVTTTWVQKPGGQSWEGENVTTTTVLKEYNYADVKDKIVFTDNAGNSSSGEITASSKVDISSYSIVEKDGKVYRKINLPDKLAGDCADKFIEIPTAQAMFKDYYMDDSFDPTTGDLKLQPGQTEPYSAANKSAYIKTGTKMLAEFIDNPNIDTTTATMDDIISAVSAETLEGGQCKSYEITLDGGTKYYMIDPTKQYEDVTWTVKGNNGRLVLIIPDNKTVNLTKCKLVTETVNPLDKPATGNVKVTNGTTKAPKVDIYGGDQSVLNISQKGYISGYIIMPTGKVVADGGLGGSIDYNDGKGMSTTIGDTAIIGSLLCGEFSESNKTGVLYLDKNSGGNTPGEPILSVQASQYVRS